MKKIAFIGSGKISSFHIDAALKAGFNVTAISATNKSKSALELSKKYNIPNYFETTKELLISSLFDCVSVITPPKVTAELVGLISERNIPALIEKPGALTSHSLRKYQHLDNIFVGYNRRFYSTITELESINLKNPGIINFSIIEIVNLETEILKNIENAIINNSVHVLDLLIYLIGKCDLRDPVYSQINHNLNFRVFDFNGYRGNMNISFNSKRNTSIEFENSQINLALLPLEKLQKSNNFRIIPPQLNYPYTRYQTVYKKLSGPSEIVESGIIKPGFLNQYLDFYQFCENGIKSKKLASLADAINVLRLAEFIISSYRQYIKD